MPETSPQATMRDFAEHYAWRGRVAKHLPRLAQRVFALRNKPYRGHGFHYAMEAELGYLIARMNDYQNEITFAASLIEPIRFKEFLRTLVLAEFSARGWDLPDERQLHSHHS